MPIDGRQGSERCGRITHLQRLHGLQPIQDHLMTTRDQLRLEFRGCGQRVSVI